MREDLDKNNIPQHVAVIMDGNGRWAKKQGLKRIFGHRNGIKAVRESVEAAGELGIKYLTLYTFSTENWNRPADEVNGLMELLVETLIKEVPEFNKKNVKVSFIGDINSFPQKVQKNLNQAIELTSNNTGLVLVLALSYSSKWEILEAIKHITEDAVKGKFKPEDINAEIFEQYLCTAGIPDPDFLIRTSGEQRISNFLLWQAAYCEFYFPAVLWPDFRKADFYDAIYEYQTRERRFGKTGDQIK